MPGAEVVRILSDPKRRHASLVVAADAVVQHRLSKIAHHVYTEDSVRKLIIASLRYLDPFAKIGQSWYVAERELILDWSETRSMATPAAAPSSA